MTIMEIKQDMRKIVKKADSEVRMLTEEEKARMAELEAELMKLKEKENADEEKPVEDVPSEPTDNREGMVEDNEDKVEDPEDMVEDKMEDKMEQNACEPSDTEDEKKDSNCRKRNIKKSNVRKNTTKMEFRLMKAIRDIANNRSLDEAANAVVAEARKSMAQGGLSYGGQIQIPVNETRAFTVADEGEDIVATDIYSIMKPLRAKNVLAQAGAKFMTGLVGDVQVPILGASNVTWEGEVAAASNGAGAITSKKLQPKRLTAYIDLSKQFIIQDSADAEAAIREDIVNAINSKLEATILGEVAGSNTQPEGIFKTVEPATAAVTTFAGLTALEAEVETANVLGECKYIVSPKAKAVLRAMPKSAKNTQLVMEGGEIDGVPTYVTSNVSDSKAVYGDFTNLAVGQWGAIDLIVDPYTKAADGQVRLVINAYFDAVVLRPEAFVTAKIANA